MQRLKFIFSIEAEQNDTVLIKILTAIIRRRILLISFRARINPQIDLLQVRFIIEETTNNAAKLSKHLEKQVDILSINFSEQQMKSFCKIELQKSSSTLLME